MNNITISLKVKPRLLQEAAVLLKGQAVEAQDNAHLGATPMKLSDLDMFPTKRSNQMVPAKGVTKWSLAKRSNQMVPTKGVTKRSLVKRSNQMVPGKEEQPKSLPNNPHIRVSTEGIASSLRWT